ncbi:endonuclease/exonuclease/phosphatase family protein [Streptomyces sp. GQFP]|uniref:endonuclease/exonuclease/phosphatase family protein n=1 Tax=Streptomyces sp. GQFP TaxID=2907545 RepID=UPI001F39672D|nr:endonuclease/exonuclease/phosphatase family protein [Streptomyces sp. GQFP]UIX34271.1 endonuclease/exonuclease/phosphatase family protein [Streptomyces sp. GQFP]
MSSPKDEFRVLSWNIEHNGVDKDGSTARWDLAMDVLDAIQPHVLLRQELTRADRDGQSMVWNEARRLGHHFPFLATATPESANPTGVYLDYEVCQPTNHYEHGTKLWHPVCNPVALLKGATQALSLGSFHLCSWDPATRATEAKRLTTLGKPGMAAIIGGDGNSYPHRLNDRTPLPDWSKVEDRSHYEHRTIVRDGKRISDTVAHEILCGEHEGHPPVFVDLAYYAATELGQETALNPTASLWKTNQGSRQRIDWVLATPQVAGCLTSLRVVVNDDVIAASDHPPVLATFSFSALRRVLSSETAGARVRQSSAAAGNADAFASFTVEGSA